MENRPVVEGAQNETGNRARAECAAEVVVVRLAVERVTAGLGDGADDAAERSAVLRVDSTRLDLNFLKIFEHRVLARAAVEQAGRRNPVHREGVLRAAC